MLHSGHYICIMCITMVILFTTCFPKHREEVMFGSIPYFSHVGHLAKIRIANASPEPHICSRGRSQPEAKIKFSVQSEAVLRCSVHLYKCCCGQKCIFKWKIILRVTRAINIMEHFYFSNSYLGQFLRVELGGKNYYFHFQQLCRDARIRNVWRKHRK